MHERGKGNRVTLNLLSVHHNRIMRMIDVFIRRRDSRPDEFRRILSEQRENENQSARAPKPSPHYYTISKLRSRCQVLIVLALLAAGAAAQTSKPAKPTKATKEIPPVAFKAHNEGTPEGAIYGDQNLVAVTIDTAGIHYQGKGMDKPSDMPWASVSGWQANNFTSKKPSSTGAETGDYGIGINQARYFSFRTRNGRDYLAAIKALRAFAEAKERPGIG